LADVPCVTVGDTLPAGTYLGRVGNSGTSLKPHLHMTFLWYDADAQSPRSWSVPAEFSGIFSTDSAEPAELHEYVVPESGTWVSNSPF